MPSIVTLQIFSGRQNPSWELNIDQIEDLILLLAVARDATLVKPSTVISRLGYRGFTVSSSRERLPETLNAGGGVVEEAREAPSVLDNNKEIERFLLETGRPFVAVDLLKYVENEIAVLHPLAGGASTFAAPPYNPGKWNDDPYILKNNNCYNYACDLITNMKAQPGLGSGSMYRDFSCGSVGPASEQDGLVSVAGVTGSPPANSLFTALVVAPGVDFHWYRFDSNGRWSHKPGETRATDRDQGGQIILNPEIADRGIYTDFCGYFLVNTTTVRIR
jgi:hypothetical protein